jgi:hypothetical protein
MNPQKPEDTNAESPEITTVVLPTPAELLDRIIEPKQKPKRENYPFITHKKTPYLARRGKPNPVRKEDGSPGDPIPFGNWYVYQTLDGVDHRFSLKTEIYEEAKVRYHNWRNKVQQIQPTEGSLSSLLPEIVIRLKATRKAKGSMVPVNNAVARLLKYCPFMKVPWKHLTNTMILTEWADYVDNQDYALNTLRDDLLMLRTAVKLAVKKHCIPQDNDLLLGRQLEFTTDDN